MANANTKTKTKDYTFFFIATLVDLIGFFLNAYLLYRLFVLKCANRYAIIIYIILRVILYGLYLYSYFVLRNATKNIIENKPNELKKNETTALILTIVLTIIATIALVLYLYLLYRMIRCREISNWLVLFSFILNCIGFTGGYTYIYYK